MAPLGEPAGCPSWFSRQLWQGQGQGLCVIPDFVRRPDPVLLVLSPAVGPQAPDLHHQPLALPGQCPRCGWRGVNGKGCEWKGVWTRTVHRTQDSLANTGLTSVFTALPQPVRGALLKPPFYRWRP